MSKAKQVLLYIALGLVVILGAILAYKSSKVSELADRLRNALAEAALAKEREREKAAQKAAEEHRKRAEELKNQADDIVVAAIPIGTSAAELAEIINEINKEGGK